MAQKKNLYKNYKCIEMYTYNPSILKPEDKVHGVRAKRWFYYCNNYQNCEAYKNGCCMQKNTPPDNICPYGLIDRKESYNGDNTEVKKFLAETIKGHRSNAVIPLKSLSRIYNIGDYIYLPLNYLDEYCGTISKELNIINGHLISKIDFTVENIIKLINYKPVSLLQTVIESYTTDEIPMFVAQLKNFNIDLFNEVQQIIPNLNELIKNIDFRDRLALLVTLKSGNVILDNNIYYWNGTYLSINGNKIIDSLHDEEIRIYPTDKTIVLIDDNSTVNIESTIFI